MDNNGVTKKDGVAADLYPQQIQPLSHITPILKFFLKYNIMDYDSDDIPLDDNIHKHYLCGLSNFKLSKEALDTYKEKCKKHVERLKKRSRVCKQQSKKRKLATTDDEKEVKKH